MSVRVGNWLAIVATSALVVGCAGTGTSPQAFNTPEECFQFAQKAASQKDYAAAIDCLTVDTQETMAGVLVAGLTACGSSEPEKAGAGGGAQDPKPIATGTPAPSGSTGAGGSGASAGSAQASAKAAGSVGGDGSPCRLPVSFDLPKDWKPKAVTHAEDEQFAALFKQGGTTLACEIDAKPAGNIGFLRAWTGKPGDTDARGVLESFVAGQDGVSKEKYGSFTANGLDGAEVTYTYTSELLDEAKQERALAVTTNEGPVVLHLGGRDSGEHRAMLPALELARKTLHTSRAE